MRSRLIYIVFFIVLLTVLVITLNQMINNKIESIKQSTYSRVADNMRENVRSQIKEKQNGTFAIALGLSDDQEVIRFLKTGKDPKDLREFSRKLQLHTDYRNVWFQLVDRKGISRYRTWTYKSGDSLLEKRLDVKEMIHSPHIINTISVGIFSMTFKSLVPIYDKKTFIGSLEVITHFASIERSLKENGMDVAILVDKHYRPQLTHSLTNRFIEDYYLVNDSADAHLLEKIRRLGVAHFLKISDYLIDENRLITLHTLKDEVGEPMGYFILHRPVDSIDLTSLVSFEHSVKLAVPMGLILLLTVVLLTIAVRRTREAQESARILERMVRERTRELEDLNRHLEERVNEEMEKRHHQEQQLLSQEKLTAMGQMLTNISHHWRQPLNVLALNIQDFAEANEFGELDDAYIKDNVARSMKQIRYMSETIENFKRFFNEGDSDLCFSLRDIFQEIANLLEPELTHTRIRLLLPEGDIQIHGSCGEFKQVLLNIINNAIDAITRNHRPDGEIRVSMETEQDDTVITVTDNGGGIEEANLDKIFDPYFTTKFKSNGVGISLYMTKMIVENNLHGSCTVENVPGGVRFSIRIPKVA